MYIILHIHVHVHITYYTCTCTYYIHTYYMYILRTVHVHATYSIFTSLFVSLSLCLLHLTETESLQEYILFCCQAPLGGLIDKPGK